MSDPHADCNQIRPLLDAYHDNELEAEQRGAVEAHLRLCDSCRRGLAGINFVVDSMGKLPAVKLKRDLSGDIESRLLAAGGSKAQESPDAAVEEVNFAGDANQCEMQPLLDAFYDRELGPDEHKKVVHHLAGCEQCRQAVADIGRVVVSLKNLPALKPRKDVAANFEEILAAKTKVVILRRRIAWGSMGIAAAVAIVALALRLGPSGAPVAVTISANQTAPAKVEVAAIPSNTPVKLTQDHGSAQQSNVVPQVKPTTRPSNEAAKPVAIRVTPPVVAHNQAATPGKKQSTIPTDGEKIADAQLAPTKGEGIIALYDGEANSAAELGITTDEDGLYAIKL